MKLLTLTGLAAMLCASAPAQTSLINIFHAHVKPERMAEFDAGVKKIVDANSRNQGVNWIALEKIRGEGFHVMFASTYENYAELEKGGKSMGAAMAKVYTEAGVPKFFFDFDRSLAGSSSEIRRRRADLSSNVPSDQAAMFAALGKMRYLVTTAATVRPGYMRDYEDQLKTLKAAAEKAGNTRPVYVSQGGFGSKNTVFYVSRYLGSISELDEQRPTVSQMLSAGDYEKYTGVLRAGVLSMESQMWRVAPQWSNAMEQAVAIDPSFWKPKPAGPSAKPRTIAPDARKQ